MDKVFFDMFDVDTEFNMGQSYLLLKLTEGKNPLIYDYQVDMIANNPKPAIIPFGVRRKNNEICFCYNTTGKILLADYITNRKSSKSEIIGFLTNLLRILLESKSLFLNEKNFIIDKEHIYIEPVSGTLCVLYVPIDLGTDHYKVLKDFVSGLVTRTAFPDIKTGDDYLYKISGYVQEPGFSITGLYKLLNNIKNEDMSGIDKQDSLKMEGVAPLITDGRPGIAQSGNTTGAGKLQTGSWLKRIVGQKEEGISDRKNTNRKKQKKKGHTNNQPPISKVSIGQLPCNNMPDNWADEIHRQVMDETELLHKGSSSNVFLVCEKDGIVNRFEIVKERFSIGRNPLISDLVIDDRAIGRIHAEIICNGNDYYIIDKNSKNGTYLDGEKLTDGQEYMLKNNCSILFANKEYRFEESVANF